MPITFQACATEHEEIVLSKFPSKALESAIPRTIALCFANRSGSNYLSDLLKSTGLATGFREILNRPSIEEHLANSGSSSLAQYIHYQREFDQPADKYWGFKVGWSQLLMLRHLQIIPCMMMPFFIEIRRRDKVSQAVSHYIAMKTGIWTHKESEEVPYNGDEILKSFAYINWCEAQMDMTVRLLKVRPLLIYYEDLLDSPNTTIGRIFEALGLGFTCPDQRRISHVVQRNEVNRHLYERFVRDLDDLIVDWQMQT